jgi:hypothetical protein
MALCACPVSGRHTAILTTGFGDHVTSVTHPSGLALDGDRCAVGVEPDLPIEYGVRVAAPAVVAR